MKRPLPPPSRPRRPRNSLTTAELLAGLHPNFYPRMREMFHGERVAPPAAAAPAKEAA